MLSIDGSIGEGGGQILRTSLALSLCTGEPIRITRIREARRRPGLGRQHLAAVRAAVTVSEGQVSGDEPGSRELTFIPGSVRPGRYRFDIGTAGSTMLVLQTVLPALITASAASELILEGGTHNPMAPPFDFLADAYLPVVNRTGAMCRAQLERVGFYPAGGGLVRIDIEPARELKPLNLLERGRVLDIRAVAIVARLPENIAQRELAVLARKLRLGSGAVQCRNDTSSRGPGNAVVITVESEHVTEVFTGFGQRGVPAEKVASRVADATLRYLEADVPVGEHLADQLLLPFALAGGGSFVTLTPTLHTRTNASVINAFLGLSVDLEELGTDRWRLSVGRRR